MTEKSPFAVPIDKRDQADAARRALAVANSDHLTLYKAFTGSVFTRVVELSWRYC